MQLGTGSWVNYRYSVFILPFNALQVESIMIGKGSSTQETKLTKGRQPN